LAPSYRPYRTRKHHVCRHFLHSLPVALAADSAARRLDGPGPNLPHPPMVQIRKICVYCGSSAGTDPAYVAAATRFGEILAEAGIGLVYGGGSAGVMGALARAVQARGGEITGVIPEFLSVKENTFRGATEVVVTHGMHDRKQIMFERSDAFVALPGGIGTLEELVEQLTWAQLGRHKKPILIANLKGFWDGLLGLLDHMVGAG